MIIPTVSTVLESSNGIQAERVGVHLGVLVRLLNWGMIRLRGRFIVRLMGILNWGGRRVLCFVEVRKWRGANKKDENERSNTSVAIRDD